MEKLQNETAMYTRLVCVDTVGHGYYTAGRDIIIIFIISAVATSVDDTRIILGAKFECFVHFQIVWMISLQNVKNV
jgi:hypothetical protein